VSRPAARVSDMHTCPRFEQVGPQAIPHVGGPISPPGSTTVLIAGLPAARVGDMCVCTGPPDRIEQGSGTVFLGGMPAARLGDRTVHGGVITQGAQTVLIGG
jgi:uncharacterized Zn-binding protein involved in type VI secretion